MKKITANRLRSVLDYDPETGIFRWKVGRANNKVKPGDVAGCPTGHGYLRVNIDGAHHYVHRLAFLYVAGWMPRSVDHRDGNKNNNAWKNLRAATASQNNFNASRRNKNKSGFKGVHYSQSNKGYVAAIQAHGVSHHLGTFKTPEEAHAAYRAAAKILHGEFARAA